MAIAAASAAAAAATVAAAAVTNLVVSVQVDPRVEAVCFAHIRDAKRKFEEPTAALPAAAGVQFPGPCSLRRDHMVLARFLLAQGSAVFD